MPWEDPWLPGAKRLRGDHAQGRLIESVHPDGARPDYGAVLDDAKAFFTAAESLAQPQVSEASAQSVGFDGSTGRSTRRLSVAGGGFLVVVTAVGGTAGGGATG
jgi:hypothetical protein